MPRCHHWVPVKAEAALTGKDPATYPGGKARAWRLCAARVAAPGQWCPACLTALSGHSNPTIRTALAEAPGVPLSVLRTLARDKDAGVAFVAAAALNLPGNAPVTKPDPEELPR